jgi:hypothetical protein
MSNLSATEVEQRYSCTTCRHTFSADKPTFFETVRRPRLMVVEALALVGERNSLRAVARLTHHSPHRMLHWLDLAGQHTAAVSAALIRNLHLTQVQIDALWTFVKKNKRTANLMLPQMSAICGDGVPWRGPAACAPCATFAMSAAQRKPPCFWPHARAAPMAMPPASPVLSFRRLWPP